MKTTKKKKFKKLLMKTMKSNKTKSLILIPNQKTQKTNAKRFAKQDVKNVGLRRSSTSSARLPLNTRLVHLKNATKN